MIPTSTTTLTQNTTVKPYPSYDYAYNEKQINSYVSGIDAVAQAVYFILNTERYDFPIYGDNYGVSLRQYKGKGFSFLEASIENTLKDALTQDDRIKSVTVTNIEKTDIDSALIEFTVTANEGQITEVTTIGY